MLGWDVDSVYESSSLGWQNASAMGEESFPAANSSMLAIGRALLSNPRLS